MTCSASIGELPGLTHVSHVFEGVALSSVFPRRTAERAARFRCLCAGITAFSLCGNGLAARVALASSVSDSHGTQAQAPAQAHPQEPSKSAGRVVTTTPAQLTGLNFRGFTASREGVPTEAELVQLLTEPWSVTSATRTPAERGFRWMLWIEGAALVNGRGDFAAVWSQPSDFATPTLHDLAAGVPFTQASTSIGGRSTKIQWRGQRGFQLSVRSSADHSEAAFSGELSSVEELVVRSADPGGFFERRNTAGGLAGRPMRRVAPDQGTESAANKVVGLTKTDEKIAATGEHFVEHFVEHSVWETSNQGAGTAGITEHYMALREGPSAPSAQLPDQASAKIPKRWLACLVTSNPTRTSLMVVEACAATPPIAGIPMQPSEIRAKYRSIEGVEDIYLIDHSAVESWDGPRVEHAADTTGMRVRRSLKTNGLTVAALACTVVGFFVVRLRHTP